MSFRCTRWTNDPIFWVVPIVLVVFDFFIFGFLIVAIERLAYESLLFLGLAIILGLGTLESWNMVLFPHELEFVLEADRIRWGRTEKPKSQKVVHFSEVKEFLWDASERTLLADTNSMGGLTTIGEGVLRSDKLREFLVHFEECLQQHHPGKKILDRGSSKVLTNISGDLK
ncbi:hypothetical protein KIH39_21665 [Telmatocola sphagniphila]|uniref:Uncharacterized protein n=1 Tax=Telmatocola sphagniphila TaxID=1123043 RepID=A0A8E6B6H3_9BACT|nr:hypothetical protein [Telmatocola sphagniphila]QVL31428.1 hypothetical protein KIH39_21665 [Telmatocola sphagniphila]